MRGALLRAVVVGEMMKRYGALLILCFGCGGDAAPSQETLGLSECVDLPRHDCSEPLPPTDDDGGQWPTYAEATRELFDCSERPDYYWLLRHGTCSDGKTFTDQSGGFTGVLHYFAGETLVGVWRWSDIIECNDGMSCPGSGLGDPTCVETSAEDVVCTRM